MTILLQNVPNRVSLGSIMYETGNIGVMMWKISPVTTTINNFFATSRADDSTLFYRVKNVK
jgi:hypothetical protein